MKAHQLAIQAGHNEIANAITTFSGSGIKQSPSINLVPPNAQRNGSGRGTINPQSHSPVGTLRDTNNLQAEFDQLEKQKNDLEKKIQELQTLKAQSSDFKVQKQYTQYVHSEQPYEEEYYH